MARFVVVFLVISSSPLAAAQDTQWNGRLGVVVDESGGAIADARVVVRSTHGAAVQQTVTAADGSFTVDPLPMGSYWLEIAAPQFELRQLPIEMGTAGPSPIRVVLSLSSWHTDITVTAQRGVVAPIDGTASIVTGRDIADFTRRPLATVGQALDGAAGVMVQQSTHGQASPFLRGLTGYHVLNLIDGVRFNNSTFRSGPNQYLAFVDPSQVQRMEVLLGPVGAQFGSDALGGAIHVLTPMSRFSDSAAASPGIDASVFAGSADQSSGVSASVFLRGRRFSWSAGAARRRLNDLRAGGGRDSHHVLRRLFALNDEQMAEIVGERQRDTGFTQASLHTKLAARLGARQNLTAWYQESKQDEVRGYKDLWGGLGRLRSDFAPQRLRFAYGRYERLDVGRLDWVSGTFSVNSQNDGSVRQNLRTTDTVVQDDVRVDAFGYSLQAASHLGTHHSIVFGGEIYDERVDARRNQTNPVTGIVDERRPLYPNGSRYRTTGVFAQDVVHLVRADDGRGLLAQLGGRLTRVNVTTDAAENVSSSGTSFGVVDSERSYNDWTFNASLIWQATRAVSLNVLAGRGFRAPNLNDLGALGLNDLGYEVPAESAIDAGALVGASDGEGVRSNGRSVTPLRSERLFNFEMGATINWGRANVRIQAFDAELVDPIVRRTLVFPLAGAPSSIAGTPVMAIVPTAAQLAEGVVSVATALDPRAVKAFVNEGRSRYYGLETLLRYRMAGRWLAEGSYSHLQGRELNPTRFVRRLPPAQGFIALRYQPARWVSWVEASALVAGVQDRLNGGDITDERIGAARRRSDISDFFYGGRISPFILPGSDGRLGTADDLFGPTGETVAQIQDRVLPVGAIINGVSVVDDRTPVPLYTETSGFLSLNFRASVPVTKHADITLALTNALDRNYRVHGSGVDAPGRGVFATLRVTY